MKYNTNSATTEYLVGLRDPNLTAIGESAIAVASATALHAQRAEKGKGQ